MKPGINWVSVKEKMPSTIHAASEFSNRVFVIKYKDGKIDTQNIAVAYFDYDLFVWTFNGSQDKFVPTHWAEITNFPS